MIQPYTALRCNGLRWNGMWCCSPLLWYFILLTLLSISLPRAAMKRLYGNTEQCMISLNEECLHAATFGGFHSLACADFDRPPPSSINVFALFLSFVAGVTGMASVARRSYAKGSSPTSPPLRKGLVRKKLSRYVAHCALTLTNRTDMNMASVTPVRQTPNLGQVVPQVVSLFTRKA